MFGINKFQLIEWCAAVAAPVLICAIIAVHFYSAGHEDAVKALQPQIDQLTQTVHIDDATIKTLHEDAAVNEKLLEEYQHELDTLNQQTIAQQNAIQELQAHDKDVDAYLVTPIPPSLRSLLNNDPAAPAGGEDGVSPAAKSAGLPLPTSAPGPPGNNGRPAR